jgi:hypothetical protein
MSSSYLGQLPRKLDGVDFGAIEIRAVARKFCAP